MRATLIRYERVHNLGNFENERIGIEIQLEEGEKADEAIRLAKIFVNRQLHAAMPETEASELEIITSEIDEEGQTENG